MAAIWVKTSWPKIYFHVFQHFSVHLFLLRKVLIRSLWNWLKISPAYLLSSIAISSAFTVSRSREQPLFTFDCDLANSEQEPASSTINEQIRLLLIANRCLITSLIDRNRLSVIDLLIARILLLYMYNIARRRVLLRMRVASRSLARCFDYWEHWKGGEARSFRDCLSFSLSLRFIDGWDRDAFRSAPTTNFLQGIFGVRCRATATSSSFARHDQSQFTVTLVAGVSKEWGVGARGQGGGELSRFSFRPPSHRVHRCNERPGARGLGTKVLYCQIASRKEMFISPNSPYEYSCKDRRYDHTVPGHLL